MCLIVMFLFAVIPCIPCDVVFGREVICVLNRSWCPNGGFTFVVFCGYLFDPILAHCGHLWHPFLKVFGVAGHHSGHLGAQGGPGLYLCADVGLRGHPFWIHFLYFVVQGGSMGPLGSKQSWF
jgi:hypothetical protein